MTFGFHVPHSDWLTGMCHRISTIFNPYFYCGDDASLRICMGLDWLISFGWRFMFLKVPFICWSTIKMRTISFAPLLILWVRSRSPCLSWWFGKQKFWKWQQWAVWLGSFCEWLELEKHDTFSVGDLFLMSRATALMADSSLASSRPSFKVSRVKPG